MLLPMIKGLETLAAELPGLEAGEGRSRLAAAGGFLREELLPHASAEEAVLYPAVEQVSHAPGSLVTMRADHREVVRRIDALAAASSGDSLAAVPFQLVGLAAILELHFRKEEELLLPLLDRALEPAEADQLFAQMTRHVEEAGGEEGAPLH